MQEEFTLLRILVSVGDICRDGPEAQRVHNGEGPCAHGEDIAQDAAHACGRTLEWLDVAGMVVGFDLEGAGPAVAYVNDAGVFARTLHHAIALGGQPLEVNAVTCRSSARSTSRCKYPAQ